MRELRRLTAVALVFAVLVAGSPASAQQEVSYPVTNKFGGRCLDAAWDYIGQNGTPVVLWDCYGPGQLNQQWYFRPVHHYYPEYQIVNKASGRCLDAAAQYGGVNGTPIQLWDCYGPGQLNQVWIVYQGGAGHLDYTIRSKLYGRVLDAAWEWQGGNRTPIQLWDYYGAGSLNQQWRWL